MPTLRQKRASRTKRTIKLVAATITLPFLAAVAAFSVYRYHFDGPFSTATSTWGEFGDFIGGVVNPVAGLVTIILLVLTLRSQQDELEEQRTQIARQGFEQTFFTWLAAYSDAVSSLEIERSGKWLTGVHALGKMIKTDGVINGMIVEYRLNEFSRNSEADKENQRVALRVEIGDWWSQVYREHEPQLGRLIRTLFTLVRWVDRHPGLMESEKWDYVSIVRARLSSPELRFLFFNAFYPQGRPFTQYLERYALLDNLPLSSDAFIKLCANMDSFPFEFQALNSDLARAERSGVDGRPDD
ncbi:hypothetical protein A7J71_18025 [Achromobacter insolitus]|uniref:putative phage abortive infection protein n=1 Tax=Achromobacter insolitus TaxID=217204 RepID=UPI0007C7160C|nr:putative phage abortive infection protein [Achromobacter insolitus]OAE52867.1 hypothetical protein A7J71_18025 [Achromobacter insolitus]OCZ50648.1 hypothetical protein A7P22_15315 [Achromobacter insolitus]